MKHLITALIITCLGLSGGSDEVHLVREGQVSFHLNKEVLNKEDIQYYLLLLDPEMNPISKMEDDDFSWEQDVKPLDIYEYWEKKDEELYYILLTKVVYTMDKPVGYFSSQRLSDVSFIQKTLPSFEVEELGPREYHLEGKFLSPSIDYKLEFYRPWELKAHYPKLGAYHEIHEADLGKPVLTAVQHNHHFGKVLFQKTSKMSTSITHYYKDGKKTLAVNYTLNYIHNLPPGLFGGYKTMVDEITNGIRDLIVNTRKVCREDT